MMKRILILRHAQTAGKQGGQHDYDRRLTAEGEHEVRKTGSFFLATSIMPDYIVSSSAVRTRSTVTLLNESLQLPAASIVFYDELYEATTDLWLDHIAKLPQHAHFALLVGHNPTVSMLASIFAKRMIDLAPAGYAAFDSRALNWADFISSVYPHHFSQQGL